MKILNAVISSNGFSSSSGSSVNLVFSFPTVIRPGICQVEQRRSIREIKGEISTNLIIIGLIN